MRHARTRSRTAVLVAAVATAGLVGAVRPAGPALADTPAPPTYDCIVTVDLLGVPVSATLPIPVSTTLPNVPMYDGTPVVAGAAPLTAALDLDALSDVGGMAVLSAIVQLVGFDGLLGGSLGLDPTHALSVGPVPVTASLAAPAQELDDLIDDDVLTATGSLDPFVPRGSGLESVMLPASFTLGLAGTSGPSVGVLAPLSFPPVTCSSTTGAPVVVGKVSVAAAGATWTPAPSPGLATTPAATLRVVGPHRARHGATVSFRASLPGGTGRVVARVGRRVVGQSPLARGAARVKVRGLHRGLNRIIFAAGQVTTATTVRVR